MDKLVVKLSRSPVCVFVELSNTGSTAGEYLPGRPEWFPIMTKRLQVKSPKSLGTEKMFWREQTPLTSGFAVSDYRVQGMGLLKFILDLEKPPTSTLNLENIYVILSRASDWENLAVLREFDEKIFDGHPKEKLMEYDKKLKLLNQLTKAVYENGMDIYT